MNRKTAYLYLVLTFTIWGSLYVVSKYTLGKLPPFTISFLRFLLASAALSVMPGRDRGRKFERRDYKYIALLGIAGYFAAVGAQLLGTKLAGASTASLLNSLNPVTMTLFGALFLKERLTVNKTAGILLALSGVYIILGNGDKNGALGGILLSLFSVFLWSAVSVMMRRMNQKYGPLQVTRAGCMTAAACYFPVCIRETAGGGVSFDVSCVIALLYMGIVCTGAAYFLWNKSLSMLEAGTCSAFYPIQPMVSALLGAVFLGEEIGLSFVCGAALIITGVLVSLWRRRKGIEGEKECGSVCVK